MWQTPIGDRVLTGAERTLFVLAAQQLYEELRYDQSKYDVVTKTEWQSGNPLFDNEPLRTRVCAVYSVAEAFLDAEKESPSLFAWSESALHAIVAFCKEQLENELAGNSSYNNPNQKWQATFKDALRWTRHDIPDNPARLPSAFKEWVAERWTWDEDWKAADLLMDLDPERCSKLKAMLGLHQDYFSEPFPLHTHGKYLGAVEFFEELAPEVALLLDT